MISPTFLLVFISLFVSIGIFVNAGVKRYLNDRIPVPSSSFAFDLGSPRNFLEGNAPVAWNETAYAGTGVQVLTASTVVGVEVTNPSLQLLNTYLSIPLSTNNLNQESQSLFYNVNTINDSRLERGVSIRIVFSLPNSISVSRTLFKLVPKSFSHSDSGISLIINGNDAVGGSPNENDITFRVFNRGRSCNSVRNGCNLDSKGFILPNTWYDIFITLGPTGIGRLYSNATLIAEGSPYKIHSFIDYSMTIWQQSNPDWTPTSTSVYIRSVEIYKMALTQKHINDISFNKELELSELYSSYYYDNIGSNLINFNKNNDFEFDNRLYSDPIHASAVQIPVSPKSYYFLFDGKSSFLLNKQYNNASVYLHGNATFLMDVLKSPNINGILLRDDDSYIQLQNELNPIVMGGAFTLRLVFKFTSTNMNEMINDVIIFSCSSSNYGVEVNRISLSTINRQTDINVPSNVIFQFSITYGGYTREYIDADTGRFNSQPESALGWYDILIIVNVDKSIYFYNHGVLLSQSFITLPYLSSRPYCYLGRDSNSASSHNSFRGAFRLFDYYPGVISASKISSFLLPNDTIATSISPDWKSIDFTFSDPYIVTDETVSTCILRNDAFWQPNITTTSSSDSNESTSTSSFSSQFFSSFASPTQPPSSTYIPNTNIIRGSLVCKSKAYLNLGKLLFGGDRLTIFLVFRLLNNFNKNGIIFDLGNRITPPLDNIILYVGDLNGNRASIVLDMYQNNKKCLNQSLIIPGGLPLDQDITLHIVFNDGNVIFYIDNVEIVTFQSCSIPLVERQFSFIGYSPFIDMHQDLQVYSFKIIPKSISSVDIPIPTTFTYNYHFFSNDTTTTTYDDYPIFSATNMWSPNPFNLKPSDPSDSTTVGVNKKPTVGLHFSNRFSNGAPSVVDDFTFNENEIPHSLPTEGGTVIVSAPQYVTMAPMYLGGPFSLRLKFRSRQSQSVEQTIIDIGNGFQQDNLLVKVNGSVNKQFISLTIFRGSLSRSFISDILDGSLYWFDLHFILDKTGNIKLYNYGQLISLGKIWLPMPGLRSLAFIGKSFIDVHGTATYLFDVAFSIFHYQPSVVSASSFSSLYARDRPPSVLSKVDGVWSVVESSTSYPLKVNFANGGQFFDCLAKIILNCEVNPLQTPDTKTCDIDISTDAQRKILMDNIRTSANSITTDIDYNVNSEFLNIQKSMSDYIRLDNMYSDSSYAGDGSTGQIVAVEYYEPSVLIFSELDHRKLLDNCNLLQTYGISASGFGSGYKYLAPVSAFDKDDLLYLAIGAYGYRMFLIPPAIMFRYSQTSPNGPMPTPDQRAANVFSFTSTDYFDGNRFYDDFRANRSISTFTLAEGEYIIQIESKCNYRYKFTTNKGRTLVIGESRLIDRLNDCFQPLHFVNTTKFDVVTAPTVPYPPNLSPSFFKEGISPLAVVEAPEGFALHYVEGSLGSMFAWKWHWIQTPLSYYMYNIIFDYDSTTSITSAQPTQVITLDMYNHSPLEQTSWMVHSLSTSEERSYTNTNTHDFNWHWDVSVTVSADVKWFESLSTSLSVTTSGGESTSNSESFTYGKSIVTSQDDTQMLMANVPSKSKVTATLLVYTGIVNIPYTADVDVLYNSGSTSHTVTKGIFTHVRATSIIVTYSDASPLDNDSAQFKS